MRTFITLEKKLRQDIPKEFMADNDVSKSDEEVVEYFISEYTGPGDRVLDIFAGLGTTLLVAEKMGRVPFGIELNKNRFAHIISRVQHKENVIHGDARHLKMYDLPLIDFVYTSPPFMMQDDEEYALTSYTTKGNYEDYLQEIGTIFEDLRIILKPMAHVLVHVANFKRDGVTTLAWDITKLISEVLHFEGEVVLYWKSPE